MVKLLHRRQLCDWRRGTFSASNPRAGAAGGKEETYDLDPGFVAGSPGGRRLRTLWGGRRGRHHSGARVDRQAAAAYGARHVARGAALARGAAGRAGVLQAPAGELAVRRGRGVWAADRSVFWRAARGNHLRCHVTESFWSVPASDLRE